MFTSKNILIALVALLIVLAFLDWREKAKSKELHNEEVLEWTDYKGTEYKVKINRSVHGK